MLWCQWSNPQLLPEGLPSSWRKEGQEHTGRDLGACFPLVLGVQVYIFWGQMETGYLL